jgi:ABC-type glycerol-3-phosphate transport system permease component
MLLLRRLLHDQSGQIARHVITIGVVVVVVILVLVEVGPIVWLRVSSINDAEEIATEAASQYFQNKNEDVARQLVASKMKTMGFSDDEIMASVVQFLPEGPVPKTLARITVVRYAKTLVSRHISWLKKYEKISKTAESAISTEKQ